MKDLYNTLTINASKNKLLYHYTSIETLRIILTNKSLMLSRLDKVNDPKENQCITSLWNKKIFVACFTNTIENEEYFFNNYGKVRITLLNNFYNTPIFFDNKLTRQLSQTVTNHNLKDNSIEITDYCKENNWGVHNITFADIYYTNNLSSHIADDGYELNAGLIKERFGLDYNNSNRDWSIEKECRLRVSVKPFLREYFAEGKQVIYPKPIFEHLFIPIENQILRIELYKHCLSSEKMVFNEIVSKLFN